MTEVGKFDSEEAKEQPTGVMKDGRKVYRVLKDIVPLGRAKGQTTE